MKLSFIAPIDRLRGAIRDISGTGGIVAADSSTAGKWARRYVRPANNLTAHQVLIRGYMAAAANGYQALTSAEASGWESAARLIKRLDVLGAQYELDGIELYAQVNTYRQMQGQALLDTVPTIASTIAVQTATVTMAATDVVVAGDCVGVADTDWLFIRLTEAIAGDSQARQARENELRVITTDFASAMVHPSTSAYTLTMQADMFALAQGNRVGVEVRSLSAAYVQGNRLFQANVAVA